MFRIARRVANDRVISTVDPQARHGHKTSARGFDGYKGHVAIDPDTEIVTATTVTAANAGDAEPAEELLADDLPERAPGDDDRNDQDRPGDGGGDGHGDAGGGRGRGKRCRAPVGGLRRRRLRRRQLLATLEMRARGS